MPRKRNYPDRRGEIAHYPDHQILEFRAHVGCCHVCNQKHGERMTAQEWRFDFWTPHPSCTCSLVPITGKGMNHASQGRTAEHGLLPTHDDLEDFDPDGW